MASILFCYSHTTCKCCSARGNMLSTLENHEVVDEYLHKELLENRIGRYN